MKRSVVFVSSIVFGLLLVLANSSFAAFAASDLVPQIKVRVDFDRDGSLTENDDMLAQAAGYRFDFQMGGAFLLANVDDDDLDSLPDSEDDRINGLHDLEDLAPIEVSFSYSSDAKISAHTQGFEAFEDSEAYNFKSDTALQLSVSALSGGDHIRLFIEKDAAASDLSVRFLPFELNRAFNLTNLGSVKLLAESKRFAHTDWDGRVRLKLSLKNVQGRTLSDQVMRFRSLKV